MPIAFPVLRSPTAQAGPSRSYHRPRVTDFTSTTTPNLANYARFASRNPWVAARKETKKEANADPTKLRNHDIPFRTVMLVKQDGSLSEPQSTTSILRGLDLDVHSLTVVKADPPIVKIINLEEEREAEREREARIKLGRRLSVEDKEVQVGWTAAEGDMSHKIQLAKSILEKGDRVHITFAMRANSAGGARTYMPDDRKKEIVQRFTSELETVGKQWKDQERTGSLWICHWQPLPSVSSGLREKVVASEVDKKRARDEKKEARRLKEEMRLRKAKEKQSK